MCKLCVSKVGRVVGWGVFAILALPFLFLLGLGLLLGFIIDPFGKNPPGTYELGHER